MKARQDRGHGVTGELISKYAQWQRKTNAKEASALSTQYGITGTFAAVALFLTLGMVTLRWLSDPCQHEHSRILI